MKTMLVICFWVFALDAVARVLMLASYEYPRPKTRAVDAGEGIINAVLALFIALALWKVP
jgi:hypothetical protein